MDTILSNPTAISSRRAAAAKKPSKASRAAAFAAAQISMFEDDWFGRVADAVAQVATQEEVDAAAGSDVAGMQHGIHAAPASDNASDLCDQAAEAQPQPVPSYVASALDDPAIVCEQSMARAKGTELVVGGNVVDYREFKSLLDKRNTCKGGVSPGIRDEGKTMGRAILKASVTPKEHEARLAAVLGDSVRMTDSGRLLVDRKADARPRCVDRHQTFLGSLCLRLGIDFDQVHRVLDAKAMSVQRWQAVDGTLPIPIERLERLGEIAEAVMHLVPSYDSPLLMKPAAQELPCLILALRWAMQVHSGGLAVTGRTTIASDWNADAYQDLDALDARRARSTAFMLDEMLDLPTKVVPFVSSSMMQIEWVDQPTPFSALCRLANWTSGEACRALDMSTGDFRAAQRGKMEPDPEHMLGALIGASKAVSDAYEVIEAAYDGGDISAYAAQDIALAWLICHASSVTLIDSPHNVHEEGWVVRSMIEDSCPDLIEPRLAEVD